MTLPTITMPTSRSLRFAPAILGVVALTLFGQQQMTFEHTPKPQGDPATLRQALEKDLANVSNHEKYIAVIFAEARQKGERWPMLPELHTAYENWIRQNPRLPAVHWGLGQVKYLERNPDAAGDYQAAIQCDPNFARAYESLATFYYDHGDQAHRAEVLRKAMELDPTNSTSAEQYALSLGSSSLELFRKAVEDHDARFANADSLYLINKLQDEVPEAERQSLLERACKKYASQPNPLGMSGIPMKALFELYAVQDPSKALEFARERQKYQTAFKQWVAVVAYQEKLVQAGQLMAAGKFAEVSALLGELKAPWSLDVTPLELAKAQASAGAGDTSKAYRSLLTATATAPNKPLLTALNRCGQELGKTSSQIKDDLWNLRTASARPFQDFELEQYPSLEKHSSKETRGKVVLVNFWFPTCIPCRDEFPRLQALYDKYKSRGFTIQAVNIVSSDSVRVYPLMKAYNYPIFKSPADGWSKEVYGVQSAPTNYLLDTTGRIVATPAVYNNQLQRRLELQIEALLEKAGR